VVLWIAGTMADWDTRYREGSFDTAVKPHGLLARFQPLIPQGMVLDIASGSGRDALFLAEEGYSVCGLERSAEGLRIARDRSLALGHDISLVQADANALPFKKGCASGVTVFYFLERNIMGEIVDLLGKGGILIYETFLKRQNVIDGPRNPAFLLDDGELVSYFSALELIFYEETISSAEGKQRAIAQYVGRKR
jgi:SAM-dependent methyltransferase